MHTYRFWCRIVCSFSLTTRGQVRYWAMNPAPLSLSSPCKFPEDVRRFHSKTASCHFGKKPSSCRGCQPQRRIVEFLPYFQGEKSRCCCRPH
ncbi:hypothetical protein GDO78_021807 [Eleutherodactylus coqui]|uniref:Uncharacterized protein n=1 Tax=Eleutherodactylus coqui TaxID=57060 RepID=A0A8J6B589_ELECQ|nr:hypothetical protein GDO78_021807 [Eleutherodactylus coqui]